MEIIGKLVLYVIMACCGIGAVAAIINENSGLAKSFHEGLQAMAALFLPIVGLMVSVPYLVIGVEKIFGNLFRIMGADPAIAAAMLIPSDCGGYALFLALARSPEIVVIALTVAIMTASTVAFNIPVGLSILKKEDYPYMALGAMSGFLAIPFGVFITCLIMLITKPTIRTTFTTTGPADYLLNLDLGTILINLLPIFVFCVILAVCLKLFPQGMIKGFMVFGKLLLSALTLIAAASIIEHYTGFFSWIMGGWGFDPVLADETEQFRAIELLGSIAMMLTGAFPMVYLIRKFFGKSLAKIGKLAGLDDVGSAGLLATMANGVALFNMIGDMKPTSKVLCIAFTVCAGYSLGDWIAFNVNFQPNLVVPVFIGQFSGGIIGIIFAKLIAIPQVRRMEADYAGKDLETTLTH
ncbi:MAG: ethanolamine utilization protein EutH [Bacillota bacterium]|jgi:ethanolamine transporter|nr:ethanolamine utilization protein EutH [Clostridia bacterium]